MPVIVAIFWNALLAILGSVVARVVTSLGMGVVTYTGVSASMTFFRDLAIQHLSQLPPSVFGMLGVMKVGVCISMVISAIVMRFTLNGMSSDTIKRWRVNK